MKNYTILKGIYPINMAHIANQVVSVCAWLTNFLPPLVPPPTEKEISDSSTDDELSDLEDNIDL